MHSRSLALLLPLQESERIFSGKEEKRGDEVMPIGEIVSVLVLEIVVIILGVWMINRAGGGGRSRRCKKLSLTQSALELASEESRRA